jgi:hypothetical protein
MAGSRVRSSWVASIIGDVPPPSKIQQRPREVPAHDHVIVSMPPFNGRYNPGFYIEWEFEINDIFVSHHFSERKKIQTTISKFTDFASMWWSEYCRLYPDYIPTTWHDLKLAMRHRFFPPYYTRDMIKKLQNLTQGSYTVREYYDALETTLLYSFLEESEEDLIDRFWRGLSHEIQDLIMDAELYYVAQLFRLACRAEQKIRRRGHMENKCVKESPSPTLTKVNFYPFPPIVIVVPTTVEPESQGNSKGTTFVPPHDERHVDLIMPCDELPSDVVIPHVIEHVVVDLNISCDQTNVIHSVLRALIVEVSSSIEMSASGEIIANEIEPCDLLVEPDLNHIQLVKSNKVLAKVSDRVKVPDLSMRR